MRARIPAALLILAVAACSALPTRRYVQAADAYTAAVETVADLVRSGKVSPEDGRTLQAYTKVIRKKIDEFREAIARGEARDKLTVIWDAIRDLLRTFAMQTEVAKEKR